MLGNLRDRGDSLLHGVTGDSILPQGWDAAMSESQGCVQLRDHFSELTEPRVSAHFGRVRQNGGLALLGCVC